MTQKEESIVSVEEIPGLNASVLFVPASEICFREDRDILPMTLDDGTQYIPWGGDNQMPYRLIDRFEEDETLDVCAAFQSEVLYASGLRYVLPPACPPSISEEVDDFFDDNDMASYYLGVCKDLKRFEFSVSVLILSADGTKVTNVYRKEACYCRFAPVDASGCIPYVLYANWRLSHVPSENVEKIPLLDGRCLRADLRDRVARGERKFAVLTKIPGVDSLYYPIPVYASLFRGKWYNIKRYIGIAKESKLRNSAPIKYLIEISKRYTDELFRSEHITDEVKKAERIMRLKREMIDFLTGAQNSGKALFSTFYTSPDGKECHDIKITKIEDDKEGGDWASDHAEAINMICFAMRVHSNLVGSVPSKAQSNNSGSDKRELYTIAQALQKPYRDCSFVVHRLVIRHNGWRGVKPFCPLLQLTTLDQHKDIKETSSDE